MLSNRAFHWYSSVSRNTVVQDAERLRRRHPIPNPSHKSVQPREVHLLSWTQLCLSNETDIADRTRPCDEALPRAIVMNQMTATGAEARIFRRSALSAAWAAEAGGGYFSHISCPLRHVFTLAERADLGT